MGEGWRSSTSGYNWPWQTHTQTKPPITSHNPFLWFSMISRHTDEQAGFRQSITHTSQVVRLPVYLKVLLFLLILYPCHMKVDYKAFLTHERDLSWALYKMLYVWWWLGVWKELFWHCKEWLGWNNGSWTASGYVGREMAMKWDDGHIDIHASTAHVSIDINEDRL